MGGPFIACGVSVGCSGVSVGGISVGGMGVSVGGISVGGMGVSVGGGSGVSVGGMGVLVGLGNTILVGVRDGTRVEVAVDLCSRIRVGGSGVQVTKSFLVAVTDGVTVGCSVNVGVGVGMYSEISTAVSATAVLMGLEKAESTTSCAPKSEASDLLGFTRAAAETIQIRLNPSTPAAKTVRGPEYSRIFTLVSFHLRQLKGGFVTSAENHV